MMALVCECLLRIGFGIGHAKCDEVLLMKVELGVNYLVILLYLQSASKICCNL
jgi:hypothetical protein